MYIIRHHADFVKHFFIFFNKILIFLIKYKDYATEIQIEITYDKLRKWNNRPKNCKDKKKKWPYPKTISTKNGSNKLSNF